MLANDVSHMIPSRVVGGVPHLGTRLFPGINLRVNESIGFNIPDVVLAAAGKVVVAPRRALRGLPGEALAFVAPPPGLLAAARRGQAVVAAAGDVVFW